MCETDNLLRKKLNLKQKKEENLKFKKLKKEWNKEREKKERRKNDKERKKERYSGA